MGQTASDASTLCIACGLCCNGTIFAHVKVYPDEIQQVKDLGLALRERADETVFDLSCSCFKDGSCSVYKKRPKKCVSFICKLNKDVLNATIPFENSLQIVQAVKDYTNWVLSAVIPKDRADLRASNYRLLLIECHKKFLAKQANETLSARDEEIIRVIFEQMKLIDRFFDDTLLLIRYGELIQALPETN
jgi:uncharacterized protein